MAKKDNRFQGYDITTQAVHTGTDYDAGTGAVRRPLHMANSYKLPDDLSQVNYSSTDVTFVAYPGLKSNPGHALAWRQMKNGYGGVISFGLVFC